MVFRALFICTLAGAAYAQDASITGVVHDTTTGSPLAAVRITLEAPDLLRSTATALNGTFRFDHLSPGMFRLRYSLEGYDSPFDGATRLVRLGSDGAEKVRINLTAISTIEGVVLDEDGRPMPGMDVYTGTSLRATTAEDGSYTITRLLPGKHRIAVRIPFELRLKTLKRDPGNGDTFGYTGTEYYPGAADPGAAVEIPLSGSLHLYGIDVHLRRVRLVSFIGRVVERAGGEPFAGGRVELAMAGVPFLDDGFKLRAVESDGAFRFDLLPPGGYLFEIYRDEDGALPYRVPLELGKAGIEGRVVSVPPFPQIEGSARSDDDRAWEGRVQVTLRSGAGVREVVSTSERFSLGEVPPGKWRIDIRADARSADKQRLAVSRAEFGAQNALMQEITVAESGNPALEIRLSAQTGRITGTVFDADGKPAKQVVVTWHLEGSSLFTIYDTSRTNEDGVFSIDGLAPGRYQLMAGDSTRTYRAVVEVKAGQTTVVPLRPEKQ